MNRINSNLNAFTESNVNFFHLKLERNRVLSNSPINDNRINNEKKSKSPVRNKNNILLDNNIKNNKFHNSNLRNTHSKLHNNNSQTENKTHYPIITIKPLLTDSNFNRNNTNNRNNINEESGVYLHNKLSKSKLDSEDKNNLNLALTNNSSNNKDYNSDKYSEIKFKENPYFKNKNNLNVGNKTDNDSKDPLFSSVNLSTRYFNNTNRKYNNESSLRNIYSSHNNFLLSNQLNNKQMHITNSSTGFLFNKNNSTRNSNEMKQEEKNKENYSVSNIEPNKKDNKSSWSFDNKKNKSNFNRKKTPPQVLNTDFNINMLLLNKTKSEPISSSTLDIVFNGYEKAKAAKKRISNLIMSYAANTYQGLVRNYNEDRVSIILNISKPAKFNGSWPKCSFFAIYDGHGGSLCADFLRDNLHNYVINDSNFPSNVKEAIKNAFLNAENDFINTKALNQFGDVVDRSGSCAIVVMLVDNTCYCANVGDSRAIMSVDQGKELISLSNDHKPDDEEEKKRILSNGGKVYQIQTPLNLLGYSFSAHNTQEVFVGPTRVLPGRLSVSRSFGDVEAKRIESGGNPNVITAIPEIKVFELNEKTDFIILGCDGIFDEIKSEEALEAVWKIAGEEALKNNNVHSICISSVDLIMKTTLQRKTVDNITLLIIAFENFENKIKDIFEESQKSKLPNYLLKSSETQSKTEFYSTTSNLRIETESYTTKNKLMESNILEQEIPNILPIHSNSNKNHLNSNTNLKHHKENYFNYNNNNSKDFTSISSEKNNFNLQGLIKNQIESNSKSKSKSTQRIQILKNIGNDLNRDFKNYTNKGHSDKMARKSLEIPMVNFNKKSSANEGNKKFSDCINKNNFYRNLFIKKDSPSPLEQKSITPVHLEKINNIPVKLLSFGNNSKNNKIHIRKNKNTITPDMYNSKN